MNKLSGAELHSIVVDRGTSGTIGGNSAASSGNGTNRQNQLAEAEASGTSLSGTTGESTINPLIDTRLLPRKFSCPEEDWINRAFAMRLNPQLWQDMDRSDTAVQIVLSVRLNAEQQKMWRTLFCLLAMLKDGKDSHMTYESFRSEIVDVLRVHRSPSTFRIPFRWTMARSLARKKKALVLKRRRLPEYHQESSTGNPKMGTWQIQIKGEDLSKTPRNRVHEKEARTQRGGTAASGSDFVSFEPKDGSSQITTGVWPNCSRTLSGASWSGPARNNL